MVRIEIENEHGIYTVESDEESVGRYRDTEHFSHYVQLMRQVAAAAGFHHDTIKDYLGEE